VYGEKHAVIHPDIAVIDNVGFLIDGGIFHPGDAFTLPEEAVPTLLVPAGAPWLKLGEAVDYVRTVDPAQAFLIHDGIYNDTSLALAERLLGQLAGSDTRPVRRLAPGESTSLPGA
jgi:hypothetical protein